MFEDPKRLPLKLQNLISASSFCSDSWQGLEGRTTIVRLGRCDRPYCFEVVLRLRLLPN